jgi:hypothetical protein
MKSILSVLAVLASSMFADAIAETSQPRSSHHGDSHGL